jgi:hypothetical protein
MTTAVDTKRPITLTDRCDKCGAAAMVRATLLSGELYFCGHHGRNNGTQLVLNSVEVYDPEGVMNYGRK